MEDNSKAGPKLCPTGIHKNPVGQLMNVSVVGFGRFLLETLEDLATSLLLIGR